MRRVALFECEDAAKWEGFTESLWKRALAEEGDDWVLFRACSGELPSPAEAAAFDAVIVGGSHYSAYEEHAWIQQLLQLLPVIAAQPHTRIYGCCFGCQILARALGGVVGKNPSGQFVLTLEAVQPTQQLQQFQELHQVVQQALAAASSSSNNSSSGSSGREASATASDCAAVAGISQLELSKDPSQEAVAAAPAAAAAACGSRCFRLIESHGDQVLQLPPGAVLLASSPSAAIELWSWGPNVLASQFHLEFDEPLVLEKIWGSLKEVGRLNEQQAEESRVALEAAGNNSQQFLHVVKFFLKHGIPGATPVAPAVSTICSSSNEQTAAVAAGTAAQVHTASDGRSVLPAAAGAAAAHGSDDIQERAAADAPCQQQQQQDQAGDAAALPPEDQQTPAGQPTLSLPPVHPGMAPGSAAAAHGVTDTVPASLAAAAADGSIPSGCSSPTAASERSAATGASTSSTLPFSQIAHQRRCQVREQQLREAGERLVQDAAAAFDLRMEGYGLDLSVLQQLNDAAAEQYGSTAEIATALAQFVSDLGSRQAAVREALGSLPQLERQLKLLEAAVARLDKRSKELEGRVCAGGKGLGSVAYDYLASSLGRASSSTGGAACMGGGSLPKQ